ncbi:MAG: hypothetical protein AVDCRST_MAG02-4736, partial [uncultured Rubrobacteraceae bacterium]
WAPDGTIPQASRAISCGYAAGFGAPCLPPRSPNPSLWSCRASSPLRSRSSGACVH